MIVKSAAEKLTPFLHVMEREARAGAEPPLGMPDALEQESKQQRRRRRMAGVLGVVLLFFSGYFLTYHLFFKDISLEKLGRVDAGDAVDFRYDGVAYFHGRTLSPQGKWELSYYAPWVTALSSGKIEFYVELPGAPSVAAGEPAVGSLIIRQEAARKAIEVPLLRQRLQRVTVDWETRPLRTTRMSVEYAPIEKGQFQTIHFATRIADFSVLWLAVVAFVVGSGLLVFTTGLRRPAATVRRRRHWMLTMLAIIVTAFYFHSGGFVTDAFFPAGHGKVSGMASQLGSLLRDGSFRERNYRDAGITLIPLTVAVIELAAPRALSQAFQAHYPTSGYVMFVAFVASILFLGATLRYLLGSAKAISFMLLAILFFPFILDLYDPDSDALFIVLFPLFLAFLVRARYGLGGFLPNAVGALIVFFVMGFTKTTPMFLVLAAPLALVFPLVRPWRRTALVGVAAAAMLFLMFATGKALSNSFQHPNRNVGIPGEPFQDHVGWHMIWAAYGLYDYESAHRFVKSGQLRNERVAEATGLPIVTYLRQSRTATEKVYKPDVLNAFEEAPGFFYGTAYLRLYNHGLKFFQYTLGGDIDHVTRWRKDGFLEPVKVSGREVPALTPERKAIRYDEAWKASPLILLTKLTQIDITRLADLLLLGLAVLGILSTRYRGLVVVLLLCALAQLSFGSLVHGINRYFMFCSVALLIGLAVSLHRIAMTVWFRPSENR